MMEDQGLVFELASVWIVVPQIATVASALMLL